MTGRAGLGKESSTCFSPPRFMLPVFFTGWVSMVGIFSIPGFFFFLLHSLFLSPISFYFCFLPECVAFASKHNVLRKISCL